MFLQASETFSIISQKLKILQEELINEEFREDLRKGEMNKEMEMIRNHLSDKQWVLFVIWMLTSGLYFYFSSLVLYQSRQKVSLKCCSLHPHNLISVHHCIAGYNININVLFYWCKSLSNSCYLHLTVAPDIFCHTNDLYLHHTFISQNYKMFVNVSYGKHCLANLCL